MTVQCANDFDSNTMAGTGEMSSKIVDDTSSKLDDSLHRVSQEEAVGFREDMNFDDWMMKMVLKNNYEQYCRDASNAIRTADVFLLCTGAGFSADSGLAVFADVARVEAYALEGLKYQDLCQPDWLHTYPERFWGFWGQCFNDYRNTGPHEGYRIIDSWAERFFRHNPVGEQVRQCCKMFRAAREVNIHPTRLRLQDKRALQVFTEQGLQGLLRELGMDYMPPDLKKFRVPGGVFSSSSSSSPSSDVPSSKSLDSSSTASDSGSGRATSKDGSRLGDRRSPDRGAEATSCTSMPDENDDEDDEALSEDDDDAFEPYKVKEAPGGFFAFTSNIDAHHYDTFRACEIRECHGNTELYQCGAIRPCSHRVWRAPTNFRFQVDCNSMLAPAVEAESSTKRALPQDGASYGPNAKRARGAFEEVLKDLGLEISPSDSTGSTATPSSAALSDAPTTATTTTTTTATATATATAATTAFTAAAAAAATTPITAADTTSAAPTPATSAPATPAEAADVTAETKQAATSEPITAGMPALVEETSADGSVEARPRVGRVKGVQRQNTLRYMPPATKPRKRGNERKTSRSGFEQNHPTCPECDGPARPAILMFMDLNWEDVESQYERWEEWFEAVRFMAKSGVKDTPDGAARPLRVAILEVGAGDNVPTVRRTSEKCCKILSAHGAQARLIRINPENPLCDDEPGCAVEESTISILSTGLRAIRDIDRRIVEAKGL